MIETLNIMVGKLESKPILIPALNGRFLMKNFLLIEGDEGDDSYVRVPIAAWDEVAKEFIRIEQADKIYLIGESNHSMIQIDGINIPVLGFKVLKIDHDREITLKLNEKLMELLKQA